MKYQSAKIVVIFLLALGLAACQELPDDFCHNYDPDTVVHVPYPYPGHCNEYVECYAYFPIVLECEDGHWFNPNTDSCQIPGPYCSGWQDYLCIGDNPAVHVRHPYPGDCTRYVECYGGVAHYYQCSSGLWWNPYENKCDYPGSYCDSNYPSPTVLPLWCSYANPNDVVYYPYPFNCSLYVQCYDHVGYVHECEGGLWWHEQTRKCDYPGEYCSEGMPDRRCKDVIHDYLPDLFSCSRYVECDIGDSFEMVCPEGRFFDSVLKECRSPENSDCCKYGGYCPVHN